MIKRAHTKGYGVALFSFWNHNKLTIQIVLLYKWNVFLEVNMMHWVRDESKIYSHIIPN